MLIAPWLLNQDLKNDESYARKHFKFMYRWLKENTLLNDQAAHGNPDSAKTSGSYRGGLTTAEKEILKKCSDAYMEELKKEYVRRSTLA